MSARDLEVLRRDYEYADAAATFCGDDETARYADELREALRAAEGREIEASR